jgi:hypothetical protein
MLTSQIAKLSSGDSQRVRSAEEGTALSTMWSDKPFAGSWSGVGPEEEM